MKKFTLKNRMALSNYLLNFSKRIEAALIYRLEYLVAELENHAKDSAGYQDQTSNLKGSIGGMVLKDGKPVKFAGFSGTSEGTKAGLEFINSLIEKHAKGFAVVIVAGMEYASYVEDFHNLNVLKKTELKMFRELPKILADLKRKIEKS